MMACNCKKQRLVVDSLDAMEALKAALGDKADCYDIVIQETEAECDGGLNANLHRKLQG